MQIPVSASMAVMVYAPMLSNGKIGNLYYHWTSVNVIIAAEI